MKKRQYIIVDEGTNEFISSGTEFAVFYLKDKHHEAYRRYAGGLTISKAREIIHGLELVEQKVEGAVGK